jgi:hypothetical protein
MQEDSPFLAKFFVDYIRKRVAEEDRREHLSFMKARQLWEPCGLEKLDSIVKIPQSESRSFDCAKHFTGSWAFANSRSNSEIAPLREYTQYAKQSKTAAVAKARKKAVPKTLVILFGELRGGNLTQLTMAKHILDKVKKIATSRHRRRYAYTHAERYKSKGCTYTALPSAEHMENSVTITQVVQDLDHTSILPRRIDS